MNGFFIINQSSIIFLIFMVYTYYYDNDGIITDFDCYLMVGNCTSDADAILMLSIINYCLFYVNDYFILLFIVLIYEVDCCCY